MTNEKLCPAELLAFYMRQIYDRRLTTTSGGNLSIRDSDGSIWITPAAVDKGSLTPEDMVCVHPDGTVTGRHRPSSELPFHANIYSLRPDLHAVIHGHPAGLLAASMVRRCPAVELLPAVREICGAVALAPYAAPGSKLLGQHIGSCFAQGADLVLLENHGVCVGGRDLAEAYRRFETLEYAADLEIQARRLGMPHAAASAAEKPEEARSEKEYPVLRKMAERAFRQGLFSSALGCCALRTEQGYVRMGADGVGYEGAGGVFGTFFDAHPEIGAVIEAQPVHAMAFAVTGADYDTRAIPESYVLLRDLVRLPETADPRQLADAVDEYAPAALVENRCAWVTGSDLLQAFDRLEVLETTAKALIETAALGQIVRMEQPLIDEIKVVFHLKDRCP